VGILPHQLQVGLRLVVKVLWLIGSGGPGPQILQALLVLGQQRDMAIVIAPGLVFSRLIQVQGKVALHPKDGMNTVILACLLKGQVPVDFSMISQGDSRLPQFSGTLGDFIDTAQTVEKTRLRMTM
jgi:hypothetical protein